MNFKKRHSEFEIDDFTERKFCAAVDQQSLRIALQYTFYRLYSSPGASLYTSPHDQHILRRHHTTPQGTKSHPQSSAQLDLAERMPKQQTDLAWSQESPR